MTRSDLERRLAAEFGASAARVLARLRAIAREPGGAEAVAEALELCVEVTPSGVCVSRGRCDCAPRIAAAAPKEPTP